MNRIVSCFAVIFLGLSSPRLAAPKELGEKKATSLNIVAVVGDKVISSFDVEARVKFVVATAQISNSPEVLKNLRPQIIQSLINEAIQRKAGQDEGINITDEEVAKAIATIEGQRNMPAGAIREMLKEKNVPEKTFTDQVRAQLYWNKWLGKKLLPTIKVGDDEVEQAKAHYVAPTSSAAVKEMEISIITLPFSKKQNETVLHQTASNLVQEIRQGANFAELARQFSATDSKSFWVQPQQLDKNIAGILIGKKAGEVTEPINTGQGFSIIKVLNVRTEEVAKPEITPEQEELAKIAAIRESIMRQKFELEAQRNLRNLQREVYIEIRQ